MRKYRHISHPLSPCPASPKGLRLIRSLIAVLGIVCLPAAGVAQDGFRFEAPLVTFHLRAGAAVPNAGGDLFDFMTDELTLDRRDFSGASVGADVAFAINDRFDVVLGVATSSSSRGSESREWIGLDDLPIEQTTRFRRTPVTAALKYHLRDRGRMIGSHAWVPNRFVPYIGAGGGLMWYRIEQSGEFVDEVTFDIFREEYVSSGKAMTAQAFGGAEYWLSPQFGITLEGRYQFATGELSGDFIEFSDIDLRGFQLMAGASFRL